MWADEETAAALRIGHEMATRNGADLDAFQFDGESRREHCQNMHSSLISRGCCGSKSSSRRSQQRAAQYTGNMREWQARGALSAALDPCENYV